MPAITFFTRSCKRPEALKRNQASVQAQSDPDCQHLIVRDTVGRGLLWANSCLAKPSNLSRIKGDYVMIIDDDDWVMDVDLVKTIKLLQKEVNPDVFIVKGKIGDEIFPKAWKTPPLRGKIGSPNLIVRTEIFKKHIHNFCKQKAGDFFFAGSLFRENYHILWLDKIVFGAKPSFTLPEPVSVQFRTYLPYAPEQQLGKAYNEIMKRENGWVLFMDNDVLMLSQNYYRVMQNAIEKVGHNAGWITCMTNAIACGEQLSKDSPKNHDLAAHLSYAKQRWAAHGPIIKKLDLTEMLIPLSGFCMLTNKKAWEAAGGFKDGFLGIDNEYCKEIVKKGFGLYLLPGIYAYHVYHNKGVW